MGGRGGRNWGGRVISERVMGELATAMIAVGVLRLMDALFPTKTSRIQGATIGALFGAIGVLLRMLHA